MTNEEFCKLIEKVLREAKTQREVDNTAQSMISFINISAELTKRKLEEQTNISHLDKKVNSGETLRDFIKNSCREFYGREITDEELNALDEIKLSELVDHLDYLWTK